MCSSTKTLRRVRWPWHCRCRQQTLVSRSSTLLLSVLLLLSLTSVVVDASSDMSVLTGPPERPRDFKNPEELREYLKALSDYFSLVGRPRSCPFCWVVCHLPSCCMLWYLPLLSPAASNAPGPGSWKITEGPFSDEYTKRLDYTDQQSSKCLHDQTVDLAV